tara:strand:+ start:1872 stop:2129 length:258 start_codon:yes stop_codon:yes gene_type:complete
MSIQNEIKVSERCVKRMREENRMLARSLERRHKDVTTCIERAGPEYASQHMCAIERTAKKYNDNERSIYDYIDYIRELREQLEAA